MSLSTLTAHPLFSFTFFLFNVSSLQSQNSLPTLPSLSSACFFSSRFLFPACPIKSSSSRSPYFIDYTTDSKSVSCLIWYEQVAMRSDAPHTNRSRQQHDIYSPFLYIGKITHIQLFATYAMQVGKLFGDGECLLPKLE